MTSVHPPGCGDAAGSEESDGQQSAQTRDGIEAVWDSARHRRDLMTDGRHRHGAPSVHWQEGPLPVLHHALDGRDHLLWQDVEGALHLAVMHAPDPQRGEWRFFDKARAADVVRWILITAPTVGTLPDRPLETRLAQRHR